MNQSKTPMELIGPLPPYYEIANALWGKDANIDSDGDSYNPESTDWTELSMILRADESQRIDIDPVEGKDTLLLRTTSSELKDKVIRFLQNYGSIK